MNTPIENYFDKIFVINLARRTDRWAHVQAQMKLLGITQYNRFEAYDGIVNGNGVVCGNSGCVASHRGLLELISYHQWPRVLILEDDFSIAHTDPEMKAYVDVQGEFERMIKEVPSDWDMIYLGGQYGSNPSYRVSPHVIRLGTMLTTSSYGITPAMARRLAPHVHGLGPIDSIYCHHQPANNCYVFQPRLFVQYANVSDLTNRECSNEHCMLDQHHEEMLLDGKLQTIDAGMFYLQTEFNRRELAAAGDLNGREVIVGRDSYIIQSMSVPPHPAPWKRGEEVGYYLKAK